MPFPDPIRALLNPRFDGYKFSRLEHDEVISHYALEHKVSQTNVSGRAPLSFQEVQSRVTHNHLVICNQSRRAVYVDAELRVIVIDVDEATFKPVFRVIYELPKPIQSAAVESLQREYPSAAFVDSSSLFVSDGQGSLYALRIADIGPAELLATYELAIPAAYESSQTAVPFRMHQAVATADGRTAILVLSSKYYPRDSPAAAKTSKRTPQVNFDLWGVQIPLPLPHSLSTQPLQILWHRRGTDVPVYTSYDASREAFLFVGGSAYLPIATAPAPSYEPSPDEIASIPRADENLDTSTPASRPPPYSWTQTSDSVTIAIPLPASTPTAHIKVAFGPRTLTVLVEGAATGGADADVPLVVPRFTLKPLWDGIHPAGSLWTFDRAAESRYGILALHLDKQHEGTRWPQVFSTSGGDGGEAEVEVPETLDPTELYNIRETLEKYTAALQSGEDTSGLGLGTGVPSLAEGERDDEVDLDVGKSACVTWVGVDGSKGGYVDDSPLQILSTPFHGAVERSLVVKNGLDGVTYTLEAVASPDKAPVWEHTSTYSALSFVLASKRDTRFVHHVSSEAVFAFESGARDLGGNVYIYRGVPPKENWAKQTILKIGGGSAGALLGVGLMQVQDKAVILALCEGELVVLHGVL
ncbi:hypothetical protein GSI_15240 [Ganoderma sinense ZZ0214-1]|uniref:NudC domain-containing protein 1 n=1 Tax=Ganoderma sinense ZZ0214-1 TaxID=1077348 RepID=A0A2G8RM20_9APHY|nr:hypothetical protein GSI_15240 [Ganoderma sinense ZZ0214-1]